MDALWADAVATVTPDNLAKLDRSTDWKLCDGPTMLAISQNGHFFLSTDVPKPGYSTAPLLKDLGWRGSEVKMRSSKKAAQALTEMGLKVSETLVTSITFRA
jgi:hypothetical protein